MNMRNLLARASRVQDEVRGSRDEERQQRAEIVGKILDEAGEDPVKFIRIVRTQMGRMQRTLFTYRQVMYRVRKNDSGAIALMMEYFRQEREDGVEEDITNEQIEQLWEAGVSLGRIYSADPAILGRWYKTDHGAKRPYVEVTSWAKAHAVVSRLGMVEVATLIESFMEAFYESHMEHLSWDQPEKGLEGYLDIYEDNFPGFKKAWGVAEEV
jgi:hypothetical protein